MLPKSKRVSRRCLRLDSKRVLGASSGGQEQSHPKKAVAAFVLLLCLLHDGGLVGGEQPGVLVKILLQTWEMVS
jgi:hypothetical protein